jgi:hypothetical protein
MGIDTFMKGVRKNIADNGGKYPDKLGETDGAQYFLHGDNVKVLSAALEGNLLYRTPNGLQEVDYDRDSSYSFPTRFVPTPSPPSKSFLKRQRYARRAWEEWRRLNPYSGPLGDTGYTGPDTGYDKPAERGPGPGMGMPGWVPLPNDGPMAPNGKRGDAGGKAGAAGSVLGWLFGHLPRGPRGIIDGLPSLKHDLMGVEAQEEAARRGDGPIFIRPKKLPTSEGRDKQGALFGNMGKRYASLAGVPGLGGLGWGGAKVIGGGASAAGGSGTQAPPPYGFDEGMKHWRGSWPLPGGADDRKPADKRGGLFGAIGKHDASLAGVPGIGVPGLRGARVDGGDGAGSKANPFGVGTIHDGVLAALRDWSGENGGLGGGSTGGGGYRGSAGSGFATDGGAFGSGGHSYGGAFSSGHKARHFAGHPYGGVFSARHKARHLAGASDTQRGGSGGWDGGHGQGNRRLPWVGEHIEPRAAVEFLTGLGATKAEALGLVSAGMTESGLNSNPMGSNDNGTAFDMFQWHSRYRPLVAWAKSRGMRLGDPKTSLAMAYHELITSEGAARAYMNAHPTPEGVALGGRMFERPGRNDLGKRIQNAYSAIKSLGAAIAGPRRAPKPWDSWPADYGRPVERDPRHRGDMHKPEHQVMEFHFHDYMDTEKVAHRVVQHATKMAWAPRQAPYHDSYAYATPLDMGNQIG